MRCTRSRASANPNARPPNERGPPDPPLHPPHPPGAPPPPDDRRGERPHRVHAVGDDPGEPRGARHLVVLMQGVLVARCVRVGLHVLAGDHTRDLERMVPRGDILEPTAHQSSRTIKVLRPTTTVSPASSRSSVRSVRKSIEARPRMLSIVASALTVSPTRRARVHTYSCSPCRTLDNCRPSSGSEITLARPAAISGAAANVGGTPSPVCATADANALARSSLISKTTGGDVLPPRGSFRPLPPPR